MITGWSDDSVGKHEDMDSILGHTCGKNKRSLYPNLCFLTFLSTHG